MLHGDVEGPVQCVQSPRWFGGLCNQILGTKSRNIGAKRNSLVAARPIESQPPALEFGVRWNITENTNSSRCERHRQTLFSTQNNRKLCLSKTLPCLKTIMEAQGMTCLARAKFTAEVETYSFVYFSEML